MSLPKRQWSEDSETIRDKIRKAYPYLNEHGIELAMVEAIQIGNAIYEDLNQFEGLILDQEHVFKIRDRILETLIRLEFEKIIQ